MKDEKKQKIIRHVVGAIPLILIVIVALQVITPDIWGMAWDMLMRHAWLRWTFGILIGINVFLLLLHYVVWGATKVGMAMGDALSEVCENERKKKRFKW